MDKTRFNYLYVFAAMLGVLLLHDAIVRYQQVAPIPYSDFHGCSGKERSGKSS